jgi:ABC-type uncharacterized transport system auxiliary subunit
MRIITLVASRTAAIVLCSAMLCGLITGCGEKQESATTTAPPSSNAPATNPGPGQGKISTGADPDKAPSYPNMYGKPAGAK